MPLPETSIVWPPEQFQPAYDSMRVNDAWYVGDTASLTTEYQRTPVTRPAQYQGGLVGAAARFFWGRPQPQGQHRTRLHVPVPADLATTSADLLFSEAPRILLPDTQSKAQKRIEQIINTPATQSSLLESAEVSAALGGVYLRMVWDTEFADHVMIDSVHADRAVPEWRWGRLAAVTFWTVVEDDGKRVLRHLERHEPGVILHGLYSGDKHDLGQVVPVKEHPSTAWLAQVIDQNGSIPTGTQELTAAYIPNIRPARRWRNNFELAPLGRSDFEGVEPLFDALDEVYSSWIRDIRLAKARLIVPDGFLDHRKRGEGASFDEDQEVFSTLNMAGKAGDQGIESHQFSIRVDEHRATATEILRAILRSAGYSASTFGDDPMAVSTTATEVKARERMSERTRDKKTRYWAASLGPFVRTLLEVDNAVFRTGATATELPEVKFQETVQKDPLELAQTSRELRSAEAASTETLVRMLHPNWDGDTVDAEVKRIHKESGRDVIDPATLERS